MDLTELARRTSETGLSRQFQSYARPLFSDAIVRACGEQNELFRLARDLSCTEQLRGVERQIREQSDWLRRVNAQASEIVRGVTDAYLRFQSASDVAREITGALDRARLHANPFLGGIQTLLERCQPVVDTFASTAWLTPLEGALIADAGAVSAGLAALTHGPELPVWMRSLDHTPWRTSFVSLDAFINIVAPSFPAEEFQAKPAAEELREEVDLIVADRLANLLADLPPDYLKWWRSANAVARSTNPDRVRHAAVTLRQLIKRLLAHFAPEEEVRRWEDPRNKHFGPAKGKVSEEAKLFFILRGQDRHPIKGFVATTVASTLELATVLNAGVHEDDLTLTAVEMRLIFRRVEGTLCDLIEVARSS